MCRSSPISHILRIAVSFAAVAVLVPAVATAAAGNLGDARTVAPDALALWQRTCQSGTRCPKPPVSDFAVLTLERGPDHVYIDRRPASDVSREGLATLAPGEHILHVRGWPVWQIDLEPGHVYELKTEYVNVPERRHFLWVENATTGEIVAGDVPSDRIEMIQRSDAARDRRLSRQRFEKTLRDAGCGDALAQNRAGLFYLAGLQPVERPDLVQAHVWYGIAGARGDLAAESVRQRIAAELSPEQLESARRAATETPVADCPKDGAR